MRNDDSYEAYKRKFNLGVVGVIILMLVLWFGNFDTVITKRTGFRYSFVSDMDCLIQTLPMII